MSAGAIPAISSPVYEFDAMVGIRGTIQVRNSELPEIENEIRNAISVAIDTFECCCRGHSTNTVKLRVNRHAKIELYGLLEVSP
jgi:hypothetical protein